MLFCRSFKGTCIMTWNPDQYLKFAGPRFRPAQDLLARVHHPNPKVVYDLGCGTGNVTQLLASRWPEAQVTGVDDSASMLEKARADAPHITWQQQSIADWSPEHPADVIFSNAALHWLGQHDTLFPRLMRCLAPGGVLAIQMPRNFEEPSHTCVTDTIRSGPWADQLAHMITPSPVHTPEFYYDVMSAAQAEQQARVASHTPNQPVAQTTPSANAPITRSGHASSLDIWETQYQQVLTGPNPVKEWTKGTWLKQFLDALTTESDKAAFEQAYAQRVAQAYPERANGVTLFPFKRLFIVYNAG